MGVARLCVCVVRACRGLSHAGEGVVHACKARACVRGVMNLCSWVWVRGACVCGLVHEHVAQCIPVLGEVLKKI